MCPHKKKLRIPDPDYSQFSLETHDLLSYDDNEFKTCLCEVGIVETHEVYGIVNSIIYGGQNDD